MKHKKLFFYLFAALFLLLFFWAAHYVYIKKFKKIPSINPKAVGILTSENTDTYYDKENILFLDFENFSNTEILYDQKAHSGKFCQKVSGKNSFSTVITQSVSDFGLESLQKAGFSAYVYVYEENFEKLKADLVFSIVDNKENNIIWKGVTLNPVFMKPGVWTKISGSVDIEPEKIKNDYSVNVYLWNDSKTDILIDDILIVAGQDAQLKGDTPFCDISSEINWQPVFNYPPFPWMYLKMNEINNKNSPFLIYTHSQKHGHINDNQLVITGNFYNTNDLKDKILLLEKNKLKAFSYCEKYKIFTNDFAFNVIKNKWESSIVLAAPFIPGSKDMVFVADTFNKTAMLCDFEQSHKNSCETTTTEAIFKVLWEGPLLAFDDMGKEISHFTAPCFISQNKAFLMVIYSDGHWKLFEFTGQNWQPFSRSSKPEPYWNSNDYNYSIIKGPFFKSLNNDVLVSIASKKDGKNHTTVVYNFEKTKKSLSVIFNSDMSGIKGIDTIKAKDYHFPLKINNSYFMIRYNNEWRFDLKQVLFNDTTYQIISNIDFKGYPQSYNPKYYETTLLIPGCFINHHTSSIITICRNKSNEAQQVLPDALYMFSPVNDNK